MTKTIRRILPVCILAVFASSAKANLLYDFSYIATTGPIQSFDITLTSPVFITGGSPAFTTVDVTDGTSTWPLAISAAVLRADFGCFVFGSESAVINASPQNGCGFAIPSVDGLIGGIDFVFYPFTAGGLPTATGIYAPQILGSFFIHPGVGSDIGDGTLGAHTGTASLKITGTPAPVPEPASAALLLTVLSVLCWIRRAMVRA